MSKLTPPPRAPRCVQAYRAQVSEKCSEKINDPAIQKEALEDAINELFRSGKMSYNETGAEPKTNPNFFPKYDQLVTEYKEKGMVVIDSPSQVNQYKLTDKMIPFSTCVTTPQAHNELCTHAWFTIFRKLSDVCTPQDMKATRELSRKLSLSALIA